MRVHYLFTGLAAALLLLALLFVVVAAPAAASLPEPTLPLATADTLPIIADFEGGIPAGFVAFADSWDGSGSSTTIALGTTTGDLPTVPPIVGSTLVTITYDIAASGGWGGGPGYGGIVHDFATTQDWRGYTGFGFWYYGSNSGTEHRIELKTDGADATNSNRYAYAFDDDFSGWRYFDVPFSAFVRRYDYNPGPSPDDPINLEKVWGYGLLLAAGSSGTIWVDNVMVTRAETAVDFEAGIPAGFVAFADSWDGSGSSTTIALGTTTGDLPTVPPIVGSTVVTITYDIAASGGWGGGPGYGGIVHDFATTQDWSAYDHFNFWIFGSNSGGIHNVELKTDGADATNSNRYAYAFDDDFSGWRYFDVPFSAFVRRYDYNPGPSPDDPLNAEAVWGYGLLLAAGSSGTIWLDNIGISGPPPAELAVGFSDTAYSVTEGAVVTIAVQLNTSATDLVTVTYATADDSAIAGIDYTAATGQLVFSPGVTAQSFTIATLQDSSTEGNETVTITLSNPEGAILGTRSQATLTIVDDEAVTPGASKVVVIDDFELTTLENLTDSDGVEIGFLTWEHPSASSAITLTVPLTQPEGFPAGNQVLQMDVTVGSGQWAGFTHAFAENGEWVSQDWRAYTGIAFWIYGNNTGGTLFVDILDNRNPGSTTDDAERWSIDLADDFSGWLYFAIPFADFHRKDIGNGAPNDGFNLNTVHGYGIGAYGSVPMGTQTYYVDMVGLLVRTTIVDDFEQSTLPHGYDDAAEIGYVTWSHTSASSAITLTVPALQPSGMPADNQTLQLDVTVGSGQWAGFTHAFANATTDTWLSQDWSSYEGISFWLYGNNTGGTLFVDILDNRNPGSTSDDAERWSIDLADDFSGWKLFEIPFAEFHRKDIGNGAPNDGFNLDEVHGYGIGAYGSVPMGSQTYYIDQVMIYGNTTAGEERLEAGFSAVNYEVGEGETGLVTVTLNFTSTTPVTVTYATFEGTAQAGRDYAETSGMLVFEPGTTAQAITISTHDDIKNEGEERLIILLTSVTGAEQATVRRTALSILDDDPADPYLLDDFEGFHRFETSGNVSLSIVEVAEDAAMARPGQGPYEQILRVEVEPVTASGNNALVRTFAAPQDWSDAEGFRFWMYGNNSGDTVAITLFDNQATTTADLAPANWELLWSDEFNDPAGTPPNANYWRHEIGDGTANGIPGWGNSELEYYTDSTENAATDGNGNLVITAREVDTTTTQLPCWYGLCEYTSARLISANRVEVKYGRVEARLQLPFGQGLWPAFWMLGNDINQVGWPQSGEIDIMEHIGREPDTSYGTIHGPGYSGGTSIGGSYTLDSGVFSDTFHIFALEWEPDEIRWYVDGNLFFSVDPADLPDGTEWVYDHPFFILLNVAVGGSWPGYPDDTTTFPQTLKVDYVRVYGSRNNSERFVASFVDNFTGWKQVTIPFHSFTRSNAQPGGAPADGLGLTEVWGYGLDLPNTSSGPFLLDYTALAELNLIYMPVVSR